ncbi:hypothetical protein Leryth_026838 [Lithospermum erythrorhizon]|nr:hypothetical protein Leryth_026838 [Lithospermum erythrorhizon]
MNWKKDPYYDSIESIHKSIQLKPIIALKNIIVSSSQNDDYSIPISNVSKMCRELGIPIKVSRFMRQYPSFFEEFMGPRYNLPWFKLTEKAINLHIKEKQIYQESKVDLIDRLKKFILMSASEEKKLPMKIIQGMQWYLGLPDEFLKQPEKSLDGFFRLVEMEDGLKGLAIDSNEKEEEILSVMQVNCMKRGVYGGEKGESIAFPLFPSRGVRLRRKIADWLDDFQRLPYVSPYDDASLLDPGSDLAEKRVVAVLHELLSLFVEHAAERKKILCLRKYLGLPQKIHKAFERHPHMFYLSLKNKTCTAILKEAYQDTPEIGTHPLARVRKKYIHLMKESEAILKSRRVRNRCSECSIDVNVKDLDSTDDERSDVAVVSID